MKFFRITILYIDVYYIYAILIQVIKDTAQMISMKNFLEVKKST